MTAPGNPERLRDCVGAWLQPCLPAEGRWVPVTSILSWHAMRIAAAAANDPDWERHYARIMAGEDVYERGRLALLSRLVSS